LTDVEIIPAEYKDLLGDTPAAWHESLSQIRLESFSQSAIDKNKDFNNLLESTLGLLGQLFSLHFIKKIENTQKNLLWCFLLRG